ncbi:MAG: hypothetical protein A3F09_00800 [Chlamydiae bacterium RIFCSPHIGHO2_12_FULL_49_11]|nr:MAG: hypothetical protein A3F09_00800 [Chlamydiae bacterium RIFCSPHIGHO2_12_FULL_49_11]
MMKYVILVDCNNFFVSCETLFRPELKGKPVVVLSSNDGCAVSRSPEAKELGIKMGEPYFKFRYAFEKRGGVALSSNFSLYGDISRRVMQVLLSFGYPMEIYSVDEAFLEVEEGAVAAAHEIRRRILQWVGIEVSVGVSVTKTLAKLAVETAKKEGVSFLDPKIDRPFLDKVCVEEVWGIGSNITKRLAAHGVMRVGSLLRKPAGWARKNFSLMLERTVMELQGIPAVLLESGIDPIRSVLRSRSFKTSVTRLEELEEAVSGFAAKVALELRRHKLEATVLTVFIETSRFEKKPYFNSMTVTLSPASAMTPTLSRRAKEAMALIFVDGLAYKRAGIHISGCVAASGHQIDLFEKEEPRRIMKVVDAVNERFGRRTLFFLAEGTGKREEHVSQRYTAAWDELLTIHI